MVRLQNELLGSYPWKRRLFAYKPARSARPSSSRRTENKQGEEVCKHSYANISLLLSGIFVLKCLCIFTAVKLINVVVIYLDTRCHFAEHSRSMKSAVHDEQLHHDPAVLGQIDLPEILHVSPRTRMWLHKRNFRKRRVRKLLKCTGNRRLQHAEVRADRAKMGTEDTGLKRPSFDKAQKIKKKRLNIIT